MNIFIMFNPSEHIVSDKIARVIDGISYKT